MYVVFQQDMQLLLLINDHSWKINTTSCISAIAWRLEDAAYFCSCLRESNRVWLISSSCSGSSRPNPNWVRQSFLFFFRVKYCLVYSAVCNKRQTGLSKQGSAKKECHLNCIFKGQMGEAKSEPEDDIKTLVCTHLSIHEVPVLAFRHTFCTFLTHNAKVAMEATKAHCAAAVLRPALADNLSNLIMSDNVFFRCRVHLPLSGNKLHFYTRWCGHAMRAHTSLNFSW